MDIEKLKDEVRAYLKDALQSMLWDEFLSGDASVQEIEVRFPGYEGDWCIESVTPGYERAEDKIIDDYVNLLVSQLFYYKDEF